MALHFVAAEATDAAVGGLLGLTGAEAHHAAVVRRVRSGEPVTVGDGRGVWLEGVCEEVTSKEVAVRVAARRVEPQPTPRLVLVQALAKGDRDELAVQAATELGVDGIVPWQASRSVSRWSGPKVDKGVARWEAITRESAKQAHRAWIPDVSAPVTTKQLGALAASASVLVLEPTAEATLTAQLLNPMDERGVERDIVLVVGPEGGIAPDELDALVQAGAVLVRLGDTVLR
ncbi:16S rRNA (uracil(1498)-N(3))-methyltransferase, partial [Microbacterium sp. C448]|uniref:16S rRNA (uracil(1498)-N(3))-methyltransferase n=1 Tax=Microbacterium sp. C448 TaxID=1177594 RepID=UPI00056D9B03